MKGARVRSLYDSEAVLRQAATVLRMLCSDTSSRFAVRVPSDLEEVAQPHELALARQAALVAALRRSREALDTVAHTLDMRAHVKHSDAD